MVLRISVECSWCLLNKGKHVPGEPFPVSFNGNGGLYDLCRPCAKNLFGPFVLMRTKKLVRANRPETLPDGVYGNAWPNGTPGFDVGGTTSKPQPQPQLAKNGTAIGGRKNNGGARTHTGPKIDRRPFACLVFGACDHPGLSSPGGIDIHMKTIHGASMAEFLRKVTICGFCGDPAKTTSGLGLHIRQHHSDRISRSQNGPGLAMITMIARQGSDPHRCLTALRDHVADFLVRNAPHPAGGTQLALADSTDPEPTTLSDAHGAGDGK